MVDATRPRVVWRKSSASTPNNCVEVAAISASILVRDSKDVAGPLVVLPSHGWSTFLLGIRQGGFDLPHSA